MRLIIKEYLLQLKEKNELDFLVCDILLQQGYIMDNKPKTGNRQFGVDILAYNDDELLLCVVKQGDLRRKNWDSDQNAVRQSLDEIKDCYIDSLADKTQKKLRIAVVANGELDEAVRPNWNGYVQKNKNWGNFEVKIEFWGIDKITNDVQKDMFNEHVFESELQGFLRKALYFVGETDYRNTYFEKIIDGLLTKLTSKNTKLFNKKLSGIYLVSQMIAQFAADEGIYKIGIMVSEYLIIRFWKYMLENKCFENSDCTEWLNKFLKSYDKWNSKYYNAVKYVCDNGDCFPTYNPVEQRVLIYEIVSYLASYSYYLSFGWGRDDSSLDRGLQIYSSIVQLIDSQPMFFYPPYDVDSGVISMLCRLSDRFGNVENIHSILNRQCCNVAYDYHIYKKYPSPVDTFEDATNIHFGFPAEPYQTSCYWGTMLEWIALMEEKETYIDIHQILETDLKNVTKCVWFLRVEEESIFYDAFAMNRAGEGVSVEIGSSFEELKEAITFVMQQYAQETFSFETYSFEALEFIACRYYGYLPRVKRENRV